MKRSQGDPLPSEKDQECVQMMDSVTNITSVPCNLVCTFTELLNSRQFCCFNFDIEGIPDISLLIGKVASPSRCSTLMGSPLRVFLCKFTGSGCIVDTIMCAFCYCLDCACFRNSIRAKEMKRSQGNPLPSEKDQECLQMMDSVTNITFVPCNLVGTFMELFNIRRFGCFSFDIEGIPVISFLVDKARNNINTGTPVACTKEHKILSSQESRAGTKAIGVRPSLQTIGDLGIVGRQKTVRCNKRKSLTSKCLQQLSGYFAFLTSLTRDESLTSGDTAVNGCQMVHKSRLLLLEPAQPETSSKCRVNEDLVDANREEEEREKIKILYFSSTLLSNACRKFKIIESNESEAKQKCCMSVSVNLSHVFERMTGNNLLQNSFHHHNATWQTVSYDQGLSRSTLISDCHCSAVELFNTHEVSELTESCLISTDKEEQNSGLSASTFEYRCYGSYIVEGERVVDTYKEKGVQQPQEEQSRKLQVVDEILDPQENEDNDRKTPQWWKHNEQVGDHRDRRQMEDAPASKAAPCKVGTDNSDTGVEEKSVSAAVDDCNIREDATSLACAQELCPDRTVSRQLICAGNTIEAVCRSDYCEVLGAEELSGCKGTGTTATSSNTDGDGREQCNSMTRNECVTFGTDCDKTESIGDGRTISEEKHGRSVTAHSLGKDGSKGQCPKDMPYACVVPDTRVGANRLVRNTHNNAFGNATCNAEDENHSLPTTKTEELVSDVKLEEALRRMRVSEKKSEKDCDSDEMNEKYYKTPHIIPEFLMWTVSMLRTSQKQGHQTQQVAVVHSGLENEWNRVATFSQFQPPAGVYIIPIASTGFFLPSYAESLNNSEAKVECAFCGVHVLITEFGKGRRAMDVHRRAAPHCSFVLNQSVGNVSIAEIARTAGAKFLNKYSSGLGGGEYSPPPAFSVCVHAAFCCFLGWLFQCDPFPAKVPFTMYAVFVCCVFCFIVTRFPPETVLLWVQFLCFVFCFSVTLFLTKTVLLWVQFFFLFSLFPPSETVFLPKTVVL